MADHGPDAPVLPHFLQVDNWCGTKLLSHFLSPSIPQALMNTSPGSRWRTIGGTCGLPSFGRKTSTAGSSAPPRGKTPAASAQVQQPHPCEGLPRGRIIHIINEPIWGWPFPHVGVLFLFWWDPAVVAHTSGEKRLLLESFMTCLSHAWSRIPAPLRSAMTARQWGNEGPRDKYHSGSHSPRAAVMTVSLGTAMHAVIT